MKIINNKNEFLEVIKKDKVLVVFSATWCGPCKMITPTLEEIDTIDIYKIDVDENVDLAKEYKVFSVPSILLFKNDKLIAKTGGILSKEEIEEFSKSE